MEEVIEIVESQSQPEENLFEFDAKYFDVPVRMELDEDTVYTFAHRLRKAEPKQLIERESLIVTEMTEISAREEGFHVDDEIPNMRLWEELSMAVKGYRGTEGWHELSAEDKKRMKPGHKSAAIRSMMKARYFIEGKMDGVSIGPDSWTIRQEIGPKRAPIFVIRYTFREPEEVERLKFRRNSKSTSYVKGSQDTRMHVRTRLPAYIAHHDALIEDIQGATVQGKAFGEIDRRTYLAAVDAFWKKDLMDKFMMALEAQYLD